MPAKFSVRDMFFRLPKPMARWGWLLGLGALTGVLAGLAAAGLEYGLTRGSEFLIGRYTNLGRADVLAFRWELLLLPAAGGLASGLLVVWLCPKALGHGTDVLVRAFHREAGVLPLRGPAVRATAAIGVIACGGSAGPEGPIAALGAAIGSSIGRLLTLTPRERRIMLIAGCGAGVGAIFQCPLGGALFAAGILYRDPDFETDAIVPAFVASVVSYSVYMSFFGYGHHMLAHADRLVFAAPRELVPYLVLGPICALLCLVLRVCMRFVEHGAFHLLKLPRWLSPALGGLATGALACVLPQVMDGQYRFVQNAMDGTLLSGFESASWWWWVALFGSVAVAKCIATALTVGSGASGGLLGPIVFIGGVAGALVGALVEALVPGVFAADGENLRRALIPVGMAGVLSAGMRAPLASLVMVTEMTGSYGLIVPLMLVCVTSYVFGRRWGLNNEQVRSVAESPAHAGDALVHMLETWRVDDLMRRDWSETVQPSATLSEMVERIRPGTRPVFAVTDDGRIVGLISVPDIQRIMDLPGAAEAVIAKDMMTEDLTTVYPDDDVYHALTLMGRNNYVVLPVVSRHARRAYVGMLSREDIHLAIRRQATEMRKHLIDEHEGLSVIEYEEKLDQLVVGMSTDKPENIQRLLVPLQAVGRSLRESNFRQAFGVQVIAVEQPDGSIQCPPDIDAPLQTNQRLVAIMSEDSAERPTAD